MHIVGFVLTLLLGNAPITPIVQHAAPTSTPAVASEPAEPALIPEGIPVISPDPAPPHPLKPRFPMEARGSALARIAVELARGVLRDHSR